MKNTVIICEGITDRDLISFFLTGIGDYELVYKHKKFGLEPNQSIITLKNTDNLISIISAGGKTRINGVLNKVLDLTILETKSEDLISKIIIFMDSDDDSSDKMKKLLDNRFEKINEWCTLKEQNKSFGLVTIKSMLITIPPDSDGAIEKFVINAFKNNGVEEETIVVELGNFLEKIKHVKYLRKNEKAVDDPSNIRYRDKAKLGCLLSVVSPEWSTADLSDKLKQIDWNKLSDFNCIYRKLSEI